MGETASAPGRRRYRNRAEADELAAEFEASGLTQREFCKRREVPQKTLARYVRRYRQRSANAGGKPRWVAVELAERESSASGCGLSVVLIGGRRIEVLRMFGLGPATRIYLAAGATDMRKGFDGLHGLVRDRLGGEPLSGHLFLFANARRNRLKVLYWDGSGLWVCAKRLERGRFHWPEATDGEAKVVLSHEDLALLLGGIDLGRTKRRRWYRKVTSNE